MRSTRKMARATLVVVMGALGTGIFATEALARTFRRPTVGTQPGGMPEPGKYTMVVPGTRAGLPFWPMPSFVGPAMTAGLTAGSPSRTAFPAAFGSGTPDISRVIPDASRVLPGVAQSDKRILAVHIGTETYYVGFRTAEERAQYVQELKGVIQDMGMAVQRRRR